MAHDATKVLIGTTISTDKTVTHESGDPAVILPARAVRVDSSNELSYASGDGALIGISLGKTWVDGEEKISVSRRGLGVPIELAQYLVKAELTFISKVQVPVTITFADTGTAGSEEGSETVNEDGSVDLVLSMEGGVSTATQCKTAIDADLSAYIEVQIESGEGATAQAAFAEDAIDTMAQAVLGAPLLVSTVTGMAIPTGGAATGAIYISGALTGVGSLESDADINCALVDMSGGL